MKCPKCKIEAAIFSSRYVTKNDDTADKKTKLYMEQTIKCRNPRCPDFGKVIKTVLNELSVSTIEEGITE